MPNYMITQGRVISASMTQSRSRSRGHYVVSYRPVMTYEFQVGDATYTGSRATQWDVGFGSSADVEKFIAARPVGSTVNVYYDPANPADSFLEKGMAGMGNKGIALAVGIAAFAGAAVLIGLCVFMVMFAGVFGIALLPFLVH